MIDCPVARKPTAARVWLEKNVDAGADVAPPVVTVVIRYERGEVVTLKMFSVCGDGPVANSVALVETVMVPRVVTAMLQMGVHPATLETEKVLDPRGAHANVGIDARSAAVEISPQFETPRVLPDCLKKTCVPVVNVPTPLAVNTLSEILETVNTGPEDRANLVVGHAPPGVNIELVNTADEETVKASRCEEIVLVAVVSSVRLVNISVCDAVNPVCDTLNVPVQVDVHGFTVRPLTTPVLVPDINLKPLKRKGEPTVMVIAVVETEPVTDIVAAVKKPVAVLTELSTIPAVVEKLKVVGVVTTA